MTLNDWGENPFFFRHSILLDL